MRARRLLTLAAALTLLVTACEPPAPDGSPGDPTTGAQPATPAPVSGGSALVGVFGEPATLDPYAPSASDLTYALARPVFRSLYRFDPTGTPQPDLVETLEASGDVATVTLADATWSNGAPITSKDVQATISRAEPPSGLAAIDSVQRRGPRRLILTGSVQDWPETLARISFVMPSSNKNLSSGPFVVDRRVEGLQLVLEPNPLSDEEPYLDRLTVQYTEGLDLLLALLRRGRLDAAWMPSTVNLEERLDEFDLSHQAALGWERIVLDLSGSDLTLQQRRTVAGSLERRVMHEGFVRDGGRITDTLAPEPGPGGAGGPFQPIFRARGKGRGVSLQLAAPSGDELLELLQRLAQVQLDSNGFDVELINVDARRFYGEWAEEDPVDAALRRLAGWPGEPGAAPRWLQALPLFHVKTVMAWGPGLGGVEVNPTVEGPFDGAHEWFLTEEGR